MANDAYAPLDGKPKKVVINVNMPPAGACVDYYNPGGCPPPPPKCVCDCNKGPKFHKAKECHHNAPKPRPHKNHGKDFNPNFNGKPGGAPNGRPGGGPGGRDDFKPNGRPGGAYGHGAPGRR